ncbi:MAG: hypothetical protein IJW24_03525 [Clostridia bacterium]|nr:hypothetical protein [Clostridia bacterium]
MKEYVFDHDWGSYNELKTVRKLFLRNEIDTIDYFKTIIQEVFNMNEIDDDIFEFLDGSIFKISLHMK